MKEFNDLEKRILSIIKKSEIQNKIKTVIANKLNERADADVNIIHGLDNSESLLLSALVNNIETNYLSRVKDIARQVKINNSRLSNYLSNFQDTTGMKYNKYNLEFFGFCKKCK